MSDMTAELRERFLPDDQMHMVPRQSDGCVLMVFTEDEYKAIRDALSAPRVLESLRQQSASWHAVWKLLLELRPSFPVKESRGKAAALRAIRELAEEAHAVTSATRVPEGWMLFPVEAWEFLCGAGPLCGKHFGDVEHDDKTGRRKPYWWRSVIRTMLPATSPTPDTDELDRLRERVAELEKVMVNVYGALESENGKAIQDTMWMPYEIHASQTLFDYIDEAIDAARLREGIN